MDLTWISIVVGTILIAGYIVYSAVEKHIETLENRVSKVEKLLKQTMPEMASVEQKVNEELRELLKQGKTIEAVKRTRQEFGWSLLEAKQYVDKLKADT
ncbi:hypothetical protein [Planococcus faecalis]|uniref:50S ribosomal protein L7/L12 n=1 Tax=Planococcus faecalis TaxID=1598147 RepID=A0ABM6IU75_9BACL|nr:hypothetical protein [Planococcus faecalis]AQU79868.1 hypothetical protein AJGP001_11570 [Planococcus faecalis]OHX53474.1 hypothetical protein BB777_09720 [Planococcus faecalis]